MPIAHVRLSDAIDEYLRFRKTQVKPNTLKNDECWLRQFLTHTGNLYVRSVGPVHVDTFFAQGADRWGQSSLNLITTVLKTFFKYCRQRKWLGKDSDPAELYRTRKVPKAEMLRVPVSEFNVLLDAATYPRNRMLIALGLFLFLRASEIKLLRIGDVDLDLGEIAVTITKTDDSDIMRINPQLDRELRRYLTWYAQLHGPLNPDWFLIPGKNSICWVRNPETGKLVPDPMSGEVKMRPFRMITMPERVVQDALEQCRYPTYWQGVHTLRRSGARAFYNELCDRMGDNSALEVVSSMLHHKTLVMTQRYLGISDSRKRRDKVVMDGPMFSALEPAQNVVQIQRGSGGG